MGNPIGRHTGAPAPAPYIVEPTGPHERSIILLHGLGSNGRAFGDTLLTTGRTSSGQSLTEIFPNTRFIFPTSRWRRIKAFKRAMLTSWFDISSLDDPHLRNENQVKGLEESCAEVLELVEREADTVGRKNVVLGGISQGMATSLISLLLLGHERPIGGYIGISGWLPFLPGMEAILGLDKRKEEDDKSDSGSTVGFSDDEDTGSDSIEQVFNFVRKKISLDRDQSPISLVGKARARTPVFLGHGTADEKIKEEHGVRAGNVLSKLCFPGCTRTYEGVGHEYKVPEEIDDIVKFIRKRVEWDLEDEDKDWNDGQSGDLLLM